MFTVTYRGVVYPWHCDHMGHMNVMWYTGKFDEATWGLLAELGMTSAALVAADRCMVAAEGRTAYRREAVAGTCLTVRSVVLDAGTKSIRFVHEMRDAATDDVVAVTLLTGVCMHRTQRVSAPLPDAWREAARARAADYPLATWFRDYAVSVPA